MSLEAKREIIQKGYPGLSIREMCKIFEISRTGFYYKSAGENDYNQLLMNMIDEQYLKTPFYGSRRMRRWLNRHGYAAGREKVQRLMRKMGIEAIYPKKQTSKRNKEHAVYPYLLRGLTICRPNQVWVVDITYIRLSRGFMYLVAIMDLYSRYVLSWRLSNTLDARFCIEALEEALRFGRPEIFNSDQGAQFTCNEFIAVLQAHGIKISMDSRGRAMDNIFIERLWRSLKYEDIYIYNYETVPQLHKGLTKYFNLYDYERLHQSLDYKTPWEIHSGVTYSHNNGAGLLSIV